MPLTYSRDDPADRYTQPAFDDPPLHACDAVRWPALDDTARDAALPRLGAYVDWLTDRYDLDRRVIPPCWTHHGALIEELSALHTAWLTATSYSAGGQHILTWHTQFADARARLREWTSALTCRSEHRSASPGGPTGAWARNVDPVAD